jgi:hypothetical protein
MSDPADLLEVAFNDLREAVMPYTKLPGVDAAHATVRRRRRTKFAVAAVALVVVPLVAYAALRSPNPVAAPIPPGTNLFPTQTATAPAALQFLGTQSLPAWLTDGVVTVPDFGDPGCPKGQVHFVNGTWRATPAAAGFTPSVVLADFALGDVTRDGRDDVLVTMRCAARSDQAQPLTQVAAYTLGPSGDSILLGQVVLGGTAEQVSSPAILSDRSVRVTVVGTGAAPGQRWRSYSWTGAGFQAGQSVDLPKLDQTILNLTVTPKVAPGTLTTLDVTVHNGGTKKSDYVVVTLRSHAPALVSGVRMSLPPPAACGTPAGCLWTATFEPVAAGQSATAQFTILFTGPGDSAGAVDVKVTGWTNGVGEQPNIDGTNEVTVPLGP